MDPDEITEDADSLLRAVAASPSIELDELVVEGTLVGESFSIVRRLGSGGMGTVYLARDETLQRDLAVKLHRLGAGAEATRRLLREARAMAQLSHPNVVTVHEVGTHGEQLFIAMEYVHGHTARDWLAGEHTVDDALELYRQAGRGLVAAHAVGLIHRDFKPENLLIGDDGRVRVADFGLARTAGTIVDAGVDPRSPALVELTITGTVMGTPAYMAPEQRVGGEVDARADQYAFCVALYEALCGRRPNASDDGAIEPAELDRLPGWLRAPMARGLDVDPARRFDDMSDVLAAITPVTSRRVWPIAAAVVAVVIASVVLVYVATRGGDAVAACGDGGDEIAAVWNADAAAALAGAWSTDSHEYVAATATRLTSLLDDYATSWREQQRHSCEATRSGNQTPRLQEHSSTCLRAGLRRLEHTITALTEAGPSAAEGAIKSVRSLPPPAHCTDPERLAAAVALPDDDEVRVRVGEVRDELSRVTALGDAGAYDEALTAAQAALRAAQNLDYPPVHAEALERLASVQQNLGEPQKAVELLERAYFMARSSGHDRLAAETAADLVWINGAYVGDIDASKRWAAHALADAERAGTGTELEAKAKNGVGIMYVSLNQADEAEPLLMRALELRRAAGEPLAIAQALHGVAMLDELRGRYALAIERYTEIRDLVVAAQGAGHPNVLYAIVGLGTAEFSRGHVEEALGHYERGRQLAVDALGADHPRTIELDENIALCLSELGQHARAAEVLGRVLATMSKDNGPSYAQTAMNLGVILLRAERTDEAIVRLDEAVAGFAAALGEDSPWVAQALLARAEVDVDREPAAAIEQLRRADAIFAEAMPEHELRAKTLGLLARAHAAMGSFPAAIAAAERAVAIAEASEVDAQVLAQLRSTLDLSRAGKRHP